MHTMLDTVLAQEQNHLRADSHLSLPLRSLIRRALKH